MTAPKYVSVRKKALCVTVSALIVASFQTAHAGEVADALTSLAEDDIVTRSVSLSDIGITAPLAFSSSFVTRDIYFPVPAGVPLIEPSLAFDATYLRGDGGTTTYVLSLDGYAVAARSPEAERGEIGFDIGVDGAPRDNGFVRLGIEWQASVGKFYCYDTVPNGNQLIVHTDTALEYSYDAADIITVASAFSALPQDVTLLVAGGWLDAKSYDAAWRLGVALKRAGKTVHLRALPAEGDTVDASAIKVPEALRPIPAFAALANGGTVTLENDAQAGAYLLLGAAQADVAVAGDSLTAAINAAIRALAQEITAAEAEAQGALQALADKQFTLGRPAEASSFSVRLLGGKPVIAVQPEGGKEAAGLFSALWLRSAISGDMIVHTAKPPAPDINAVPLLPLGAPAGTLDVLALGEWSTTSDLGSDIPPGRVPTSIHVSVAAAPGATPTRPVASLFLNDMLLGAKQLEANGAPETISADVPAYMLLPSNRIVVRFQRQPASDACREQPQAFPVSVLPDSYLQLGPAPRTEDFASVTASLSGDSLVAVNSGWLEHPLATLPNVIALAYASGISPDRADFRPADRPAIPEPSRPFLFLGVAVEGESQRASVSGSTVSITTTSGTTLFDASGLSGVALLQAETDGQQPGLSYLADGAGPLIEEPLMLRHGDVAVIGSAGVLAQVRTSGKPLAENGVPDRLTEKGVGFTLRRLADTDFWFRQVPVTLTVSILGGFALLILLARLAKRRKRDDKS